MGIHFLISQIIGGMCIVILTGWMGMPADAYYKYAILMTGITAILSMIPAWFLYRRDQALRIAGGVIPAERVKGMKLSEGILLLLMGAGLAQYGNVLVGFLQMFLKSTEYQQTMEIISSGKGFWELVFWMGIVAPVAEEFIFRWLIYLRLRDYMKIAGAAVISGLIFGIYHGNLIQAIYASMLGMVFAYILEMSGNIWSCVLLHIGANVWSLIISQFGLKIVESNAGTMLLFTADMLLLILMIGGLYYFLNKGNKRKRRII